MSANERERQLVRGTVASIISKSGDSFQIEVREEGSQYSRKIWAKDEQRNGFIISQLQQGGVGQAFDFMCSVSYWTNGEGRQVRSLWFEEIAQYGTMQAPPQVQQPQQQPQAGLPGMGGPPQMQQQGAGLPGMGGPQQGMAPGLPMPTPGAAMARPLPQQSSDPQWQSVPPVVKEERILRQTAMKCACIFIPYLPEDQRTLNGLEVMAEYFVRYFKGGPTNPDLTNRQQPQPQQTTWSDGQPVDNGGAPDWVTQEGPVSQDYNAGPQAQQVVQQTQHGAYTGGFPS